MTLARDQLGIGCQQQVRDLYLSFVGIREGGIFVVALSVPSTALASTRPATRVMRIEPT